MNPKGINGRTARKILTDLAEEEDPDDPGNSRLKKVWLKVYAKALKGGDQAQKLFIEQAAGRARQHVQVTGENDGPVRITYDDVRQKLDEIARAAMGGGAEADDAGDAPADED